MRNPCVVSQYFEIVISLFPPSSSCPFLSIKLPHSLLIESRKGYDSKTEKKEPLPGFWVSRNKAFRHRTRGSNYAASSHPLGDIWKALYTSWGGRCFSQQPGTLFHHLKIVGEARDAKERGKSCRTRKSWPQVPRAPLLELTDRQGYGETGTLCIQPLWKTI